MAPVASYSADEAGTTVIDHANNNDFSIAGTSLVRNINGHTNGGLNSNGTTVATLPEIGETASRTIMMWIKSVESISDGWVIQWYVASIDSGAWGILKLAGQLHIQARNADSVARASVALPADGAWHHYAGTYDGTNIRLYVDGVLVSTTPLAGPLRTDSNAPTIGGWVEAATILDDIRIDDAALDQAAIASLKNTPVGTVTVVAGSIADQARANMLTALVLVEPQKLSNTDLMKQVVDAGGLGLVTVTSASPATHLERYMMSLRPV